MSLPPTPAMSPTSTLSQDTGARGLDGSEMLRPPVATRRKINAGENANPELQQRGRSFRMETGTPPPAHPGQKPLGLSPSLSGIGTKPRLSLADTTGPRVRHGWLFAQGEGREHPSSTGNMRVFCQFHPQHRFRQRAVWGGTQLLPRASPSGERRLPLGGHPQNRPASSPGPQLCWLQRLEGALQPPKPPRSLKEEAARPGRYSLRRYNEATEKECVPPDRTGWGAGDHCFTDFTQ